MSQPVTKRERRYLSKVGATASEVAACDLHYLARWMHEHARRRRQARAIEQWRAHWQSPMGSHDPTPPRGNAPTLRLVRGEA